MHSHALKLIHGKPYNVQSPNLRSYPEGRRRFFSFDSFEVMVHNYQETRRTNRTHMHLAHDLAHDARVWAKRHHPVKAAELFHDAAKVLDNSIVLVGPTSEKTVTIKTYLDGSAEHYRLALLAANSVTSSLPPRVSLRAAELHQLRAKHTVPAGMDSTTRIESSAPGHIFHRGPADMYLDLAARTGARITVDRSFAARVRIVELQYFVIELAHSGDAVGARTAADEIISILPSAQEILLPGSKRRHFESLRAWFEQHGAKFAKYGLELPRLL